MATRSFVRLAARGCLIGLLLATSLAAQEERWQELNQRVMNLNQSGPNYD